MAVTAAPGGSPVAAASSLLSCRTAALAALLAAVAATAAPWERAVVRFLLQDWDLKAGQALPKGAALVVLGTATEVKEDGQRGGVGVFLDALSRWWWLRFSAGLRKHPLCGGARRPQGGVHEEDDGVVVVEKSGADVVDDDHFAQAEPPEGLPILLKDAPRPSDLPIAPSADLRLRVRAAAGCVEKLPKDGEHALPDVWLTGGRDFAPDEDEPPAVRASSEATCMAAELRSLLIPPPTNATDFGARLRLFLEETSVSTRTNALNVLKLMRAHTAGLPPALVVVTAPYHQWRAKHVFKRVFSGGRDSSSSHPGSTQIRVLDAESAAGGAGSAAAALETAVYTKKMVVRELGAIALYWWRGWL